MDERPKKRSVGVDRSHSEQSRFLDHCIKNEILVTVFMSTGIALMGIPRGYDVECLLLGYRNPAKEPLLIYTDFITLIRSESILNLREEFSGAGTALKRKRSRRNQPRSRSHDEKFCPNRVENVDTPSQTPAP